MPLRDDETLLRLYARSGDEAAFRELARRYGGLVYGACLKDVRRPELAEDAAQAVFLDLARKAGRIRIKTSLVPWLYSASSFASRNVLRAERRRPTVPIDETVPAPEIQPDDALFQALDALGAPEREAVILRFVQGLSLAEVGAAQGVTEDAARMRIQRALKRLRTEYVPSFAVPLALTQRLANLALPKPTPLMTTPLLFAVGGIAAISVTVAATAPSLLRSSAPSSPKTTPAVTNPVLVSQISTKPGAETPAAKGGAVPMLDRPFTLRYHYLERDLRSKAMRDQQADRTRRDLTPEVDADRMTPEQMEESIAYMRRPRAIYERDITLSFDGRTLYLECAGNALAQHEVFLVQGARTFQFPQNSPRRSPSVSDRYSLFVVPVPTVGPSLPYLPLVKGSQTLSATGAPGKDGKPWYNPGRVEVKGGKVTRIVQYAPGETRPYGITTLSGHRKINGFAIAGTAVYKESAPEGPTKTREFRLTSASDQPLPADRFVPESYLPEKTDFFVSSRMRGRDFPYDRAKGSLDAQIQTFLKEWR